MLSDLRAAVGLLTRLPVRGHAAPTSREVWAYPVVGAAIGLAGASVYGVARAGLPAPMASLLAVAATLLLTGALHEDGLADTADGMGGGGTRARKLEIMRDSRIGTFGAVALIVSLGLRVGAVAALDAPGPAMAALVVAHSGGRAAIVALLWALPSARSDGVAAALGRPPAGRGAAAVGIAMVVAATLLSPVPAAAATAAACVVTAGMAALARWQLDGHTGDVLGAAEQVCECAILLAVVAAEGAS